MAVDFGEYEQVYGAALKKGSDFMLETRDYLISRHPASKKYISNIKWMLKKRHGTFLAGGRFVMSVLGFLLQVDIVFHYPMTEIEIEWQTFRYRGYLNYSSDSWPEASAASSAASLQDVRRQVDSFLTEHEYFQKNKVYLLSICDQHGLNNNLRRQVIERCAEPHRRTAPNLIKIVKSFDPSQMLKTWEDDC